MPAFHSADTDQVNALRSGGWAGELRFAVCPNDVVFQATVNQTITGSSFISFAWDGLLQGAYADVVAGMTFFITATDDPTELRRPLLRGRASQVPTSTVFYCNESDINLTDGMILTVVTNFEVLQKDRIGNLVDGFQAFQNLAPLVKNMKSFYYVEDAVEGQFSFAPEMQVMAQGATPGSYHWTIAGATYDSGSSSTQDITVTVPYGHTWAYLDITDSNGTPWRFIFEILVCERNDPAFMFVAHDNVTINGSVDNGWNVSTTFFAGVTELLNRTRCAIVVFDVPKVGDTDLFDNVAFVGYIVQESTDITADAASSLLSQTHFELQSFAALAGQLPVPSLAIRNVSTPSAWEQMKWPTSQRVIGHLLTRYSTLANLCAIDMLYTDSTWLAGESDLEEGTLLDSINRIGDEIRARLIFFPQGDAAFEINANFLSDADRDALPTLLASGNLEPQDLFGYSLPVPYYKTVGQVEAGCATFYTDGATPVRLDAIAPATARQEGNERPVIMAQLLEANLSQADAIAAAKQRVGDLLEFLNPQVTVPSTLKDGWHCLTPSTRVWLTYDLPGTDSTRGLPVLSSERYLLQSVALTWSVATGTWDVQGTPRLETRGGVAQQAATVSPNTINTDVPVLPILSDYDAFTPDSSLNYPSNDVDADYQQPYDPFDLSQYTPLTTEDAANVADNTPGLTCAIISPTVNFSTNTSRYTPRATTIGATYTATARGMARIQSDGWQEHRDLQSSQDSFSIDPSFGAWTNGVGFTPTDGGPVAGPAYIRSLVISRALASTTLTSLRITFDLTKGSYSAVTPVALIFLNGSPVASVNPASITDGSNKTLTWTGNTAGVTSIAIQIVTSYQPGPSYSGAAILTSMDIAGTGTDPYTGLPGSAIYGDAFYRGQDGEEWELYPTGYGLLLNGSPLAVPPAYNENHEYTFTYTGDGNQTPFNYQDSDYSNNQNLPLYIRVCGPNMGS